MPTEQPGTGTTGTPRRVFQHGDGFRDGKFPAPQADHAHARRNVVIEHDNGVFGEMPQHPIAHGADAGNLVGNGLDFQPGVGVVFSLACWHEERRRRKQLVAGDRAASAAAEDDQAQTEWAEFRPERRGGRVR